MSISLQITCLRRHIAVGDPSLGGGKVYRERRTLAGLALYVDVPVHHSYEVPRDSEAETAAFMFAVQAL